MKNFPPGSGALNDHQKNCRALLISGIFLGIGIAGFIDEAVFHQLLQWHNFYWNTNRHGQIFSDGLFHIGSTLILIAGGINLWRTRTSPNPLRAKLILSAILIGAGGFNVYDGVVQHVIFHFHLVNERVCPLPMSGNNSIWNCPKDIPYEIVWISIGLVIAAAGILRWRRITISIRP